MSKRIYAITLALLVSASCITAAEQTAKKAKTTKTTAAVETKEEQKAPRLTIVEPVKDFGTVPKGDKIDWSFLIKNPGTADLNITNARPSCGCTVADFDKVIKP